MLRFRFYIILILFSSISQVEVTCQQLKQKPKFDTESKVESDYFNEYYIEKNEDLFTIYAVKEVNVRYDKLIQLMNDFEKLPDFMPGYREIDIKAGNQIFAGIDFRPDFSPFLSQFTNEVTIYEDSVFYIQTWQQLNEDDAHVIVHNSNAPKLNNGYWQLLLLGNGKVKIEYYMFIKPPVDIPFWLYKWIVKNVYEEVFEAVINTCECSN